MKKLITYLTLASLLLVSTANAQEKVRVEKDLLGEKQFRLMPTTACRPLVRLRTSRSQAFLSITIRDS